MQQQTPQSCFGGASTFLISLSLYPMCCLSLAENVLSCSNTNITVPSPKRNKVVGDLHHAPHHDLHSFLTKDSQSAVGQLSKKHPSHPNEISCGELMVSRPVPAAPWHSPWACSFCINLSAKKLSLNHLLCQKVKEKGREGMIKGLETLYEQRIATIHRLLSLSFLEVLTCCGTTKGIWFPQER